MVPRGQSGVGDIIRPGEIAGIVITVVAIVTIVALLIPLIYHCKRSRQRKTGEYRTVTSGQEGSATNGTTGEFQVSYRAFGDEVDIRGRKTHQGKQDTRIGTALEELPNRRTYHPRSVRFSWGLHCNIF